MRKAWLLLSSLLPPWLRKLDHGILPMSDRNQPLQVSYLWTRKLLPREVSGSGYGWTACGSPEACRKRFWNLDSDPRNTGVSHLSVQLHPFTNRACETRSRCFFPERKKDRFTHFSVFPLVECLLLRVVCSALPRHAVLPSVWSCLLPALQGGLPSILPQKGSLRTSV